ncbi:hypothetical protein G9A89_021729 [Geosiphon pyriformis]|nr:hypothetical protein G9A89_021729 [Geosiphon pyriformis]
MLISPPSLPRKVTSTPIQEVPQPPSEAAIEAMDGLNRFYVSYTHIPAIYAHAHRHKIKRVLWPFYFEKNRKNNNWLNPYKITVMASSLTIAKLMSESLLEYTRRKNSSTKPKRMAKDVGKIGALDTNRIVRLCKFMDGLCSKKNNLITSKQKPED